MSRLTKGFLVAVGGWCLATGLATATDALVPPPIQGFAFTTESDLVWQPFANTEGSDVVKGSLAALLSGAGDFSSSILTCLANDTISSTVADPASTGPGQGFYYLVRGKEGGVAGTYDEGAISQLAPRDPGIGSSGATCP